MVQGKTRQKRRFLFMVKDLVEIKKNQNIGIICPEGEIVFENSDPLKKEVKSKIRKNEDIDILIIDLNLVSYLDSTGVGFLISLLKIMRQRQGKLVLSNLNKKIKKVIKLTRLDDIIEIYEDTEQALDDLK